LFTGILNSNTRDHDVGLISRLVELDEEQMLFAALGRRTVDSEIAEFVRNAVRG
jgi:hypothetical protein